ncbi:MAG TPA: hypothetical protein PK453_18920 [Leptospiraceae bacterium]|nr:hypothetical protein [Leptospiraceae bacterium]
MIETDDINSIKDKNVFCVCSLSEGENFKNAETLKLVWGHQFTEKAVSRSQLKEMTFINNLDSVLAYNAFNAPILFIFPLLECIQLQRICIWSGVPLKDQFTFRRTDRKQITAFEWRVCRFFVRSDRKISSASGYSFRKSCSDILLQGFKRKEEDPDFIPKDLKICDCCTV